MAGYETEYFGLPGLAAAADLSSSQFCVMVMASTAGQVKKATAATQTAIGILQNDPAAQGEAANVAVFGAVLALAGTSVGFTYGERVGWNTTGVVPRNTNVAAPDAAGKTIGFYAEPSSVTVTSGTTRVTVFLTGGSLWVAN